jgi:P pilus assembly chaperone PapD
MFVLQKILKRILIVAVSSLFCVSLWAQDALQILPTRVVMNSETSADLTLINKGSDAGTYRILLRNIRTDDDGQFHEAAEAQEGELFADEFIRFSPRLVTVGAASNQKVRLIVRKPRDLPPGEYRTHMVFQSLPKEAPSALDNSQEVRVSVDPIIEVSIPIIVRHGSLNAGVEFGALEFADDNLLSMEIKRSGTRSVYGDVEVFVNGGSSKGVQAGFVKGVSVYVPNSIRNFLLPLNLPDGFNPKADSLLIRFKEDPSYGGNQTTESVMPPS